MAQAGLETVVLLLQPLHHCAQQEFLIIIYYSSLRSSPFSVVRSSSTMAPGLLLSTHLFPLCPCCLSPPRGPFPTPAQESQGSTSILAKTRRLLQTFLLLLLNAAPPTNVSAILEAGKCDQVATRSPWWLSVSQASPTDTMAPSQAGLLRCFSGNHWSIFSSVSQLLLVLREQKAGKTNISRSV